ncbi:hypothetical protein FB451DRAFT_1165414 [Mycena latifolia]|nr:hypothetical protein FB451DRAFT_1165414 [Mycena latifolia]
MKAGIWTRCGEGITAGRGGAEEKDLNERRVLGVLARGLIDAVNIVQPNVNLVSADMKGAAGGMQNVGEPDGAAAEVLLSSGRPALAGLRHGEQVDRSGRGAQSTRAVGMERVVRLEMRLGTVSESESVGDMTDAFFNADKKGGLVALAGLWQDRDRRAEFFVQADSHDYFQLFDTSSTPHLPLEVVLHIIEDAHYDDHHARAQFLKQCALVCRDWSVPAQKLLFSSVSLTSQRAGAAFIAAVDRATPRGRMFGDAVLRLRVVLDHNQPFGLSQHSFAHAVTACPNLSELNLALYGCASPGKDVVGLPDVLRMRRPAPSFNDSTLDLLRAGSRITALQFSNWSENHHSITQLLDVWPSLKSLTVSGTPPKLPSTSLGPFPCALEELRMNFQTSPSVDFMKWLLHNSTASLRVLELEREPSSELLEYLVDAHRETLRSLALPSCTSHAQAHAVHKCTQLRELRVENPWSTPLLYKRLPAGVQHVALAVDQDSGLPPVLETVRSGEALKAVTLQVWDSGERHPLLPALKLACAYRGIELTITQDIRQFRSIVPFLTDVFS